MNVLYPLKLEDIGKTETQIGYIMGIFSIAALVSRLIIGPLIDRYGRMFFIRIGSAAMGLCALAYNLPVENDALLIIIRILHGLGFGFYFTSVFTWAADFAPRGRLAETIGIFGISGLLTIASGPFLGEQVLKEMGNKYEYIFILSFALITVALILSTRVREIRQKRTPSTPGTLFKLTLNPGVAQVGFAALIFGMGLSANMTFMAPFTRRAELGSVSFFFIAYTAAAVTVRIFSGRLADRFDRKSMLIPGLLSISLGLSFIHKVHTENILAVVGLVCGAGHGAVFPAMNALMMDRVGPDNRGVGNGIFNASSDIGFLVGASFFGYIADLYNFRVMYSAVGLTVGVGILTFLLWQQLFGGDEEKNGETKTNGDRFIKQQR